MTSSTSSELVPALARAAGIVNTPVPVMLPMNLTGFPGAQHLDPPPHEQDAPMTPVTLISHWFPVLAALRP
jgi:hypothetical protein